MQLDVVQKFSEVLRKVIYMMKIEKLIIDSCDKVYKAKRKRYKR